jgi:hypothetical protein
MSWLKLSESPPTERATSSSSVNVMWSRPYSPYRDLACIEPGARMSEFIELDADASETV